MIMPANKHEVCTWEIESQAQPTHADSVIVDGVENKEEASYQNFNKEEMVQILELLKRFTGSQMSNSSSSSQNKEIFMAHNNTASMPPPTRFRKNRQGTIKLDTLRGKSEFD
jgi:hypothetical protein